MALEPVRKEIEVGIAPGRAFELFTRGLQKWWPLSTHSCSEARARSVTVEERVGGTVYETRDDGQRFAWGTILIWEPPHRFVMTWHPKREPFEGQEVEVRFTGNANGTRVQLEHRGWERLGKDAADYRAMYEGGWEPVLKEFYLPATRKEEK